MKYFFNDFPPIACFLPTIFIFTFTFDFSRLLQDELTKVKVHVTNHESYIGSLEQVSDWLTEATQRLDASSDPQGEKEDVEARRDTILVRLRKNYSKIKLHACTN